MSGETQYLSEAMLRFLNSLPSSGHLVDWIRSFRDGLSALLDDVDQVMVDVNYLCNLDDPDGYRPVKTLTQHVGKGGADRIVIDTTEGARSHSERVIGQARRSGFDPTRFQPPVAFEFMMGNDAYLGTIVLWRDKGRKPISKATIGFVDSIRPFMTFVLSNLVARHGHSRPIDRAFHEALAAISDQLKLTDREQAVLAAHLFGYPYQVIAEMIHVGIDTVRKHVKAIHRKAGVMTYTELFARYFTPRLFPDGEEGGG